MAKSAFRTKRLSLQIGVGLVLLTTLLAIVAAGLKAMDDNTFETFHTIAMILMLSSYVVFIKILGAKKKAAVPEIRYSVNDGSYALFPCEPSQIIEITSGSEHASMEAVLQRTPRRERASIRAAVVRHATLDLPMLQALSQFPNIAALDVQGCRVEPEVWNELVHFDHLHLILAHGAVQQGEWRDLSFGLPEINICIEPSQLTTGDQDSLLPAA